MLLNASMDIMEPAMPILNAVKKALDQIDPFVRIQINVVQYPCWRCGKSSPAVTSVCCLEFNTSISTISDLYINIQYAKDLLSVAGNPLAATIKSRYSKSIGGSYPSNGCKYCDALFGNSPLSEFMLDGKEQSIVTLSRPAIEWMAMITINATDLSLL